MKTLVTNFFINASLIGWPKQEELRGKYNRNIPWAILLDPTSACNLHCTVCWTAEYGNRLNLTLDEINSIIVQGKELLRARRLPYSISSCYTSVNYQSITSDKHYQRLIDMGAYFIWYFHYMPVGNDAAPELLPSSRQREYAYWRIRRLRAEWFLFSMDFQIDAEYVSGCIAGASGISTSTPTATWPPACSSIIPRPPLELLTHKAYRTLIQQKEKDTTQGKSIRN